MSGCSEGRGPFAALDLPETEAPEGAWPRLVDVPDFEGPGAVATPDPAEGRRIAERLTREAQVAAAQAEAMAPPPAEDGGGRASGR